MMNYMFGSSGMMGGDVGIFFWITTLLVWGVLALLIAYLWKLVNRK